eukprot:COSAG04_NODE_1683_length_5958_cov_4.673152_5_plen_403_part_00
MSSSPGGWGEGEISRLRESVASLSRLTDEVRELPRRNPSRKAKRISSALLSQSVEDSLAKTDQILKKLQPHLERTERRLMRKIENFGAQPEPEVEIVCERGGAELPHTVSNETIAGRTDDTLGDPTINPADPSWLPRTVFVRDIEAASASAQVVKGVVSRAVPQHSESVMSGGQRSMIVSVRVRKKRAGKASWALVSFSDRAGAAKLLAENDLAAHDRLTRTQWGFEPFHPRQLHSIEALAVEFGSAVHANSWATGGTVGHAVHEFKHHHKQTEPDRTVWVGHIPDHLAVDAFSMNVSALFAPFGPIEKIETRYKSPSADGFSYAKVVFVEHAAALAALHHGVTCPAASGGSELVELDVQPLDEKLAHDSPLNQEAVVAAHISAVEAAIARYALYLPSAHRE